MTTTPSPPAAGWYPAPDGSSDPWWWDGTQWAAPAAAPAAVAQTHYPVQWTVMRAPVTLARVTQVLLIACGVLSILTIGVDLFGIVAAESFLGGSGAAYDLLVTFDTLSPLLAIVSLLVLLATAALWAVWQYHAAKAVPGETRRTPGWHAGSWFIPFVTYWFPYQNVSDLSRAVGRSRPRWLPVWWSLWIGSAIGFSVASAITTYTGQTLEMLTAGLWVDLIAELLRLAAAPLAVLVVHTITQGLVARAAQARPSYGPGI
jgi:hypothetical protein